MHQLVHLLFYKHRAAHLTKACLDMKVNFHVFQCLCLGIFQNYMKKYSIAIEIPNIHWKCIVINEINMK